MFHLTSPGVELCFQLVQCALQVLVDLHQTTGLLLAGLHPLLELSLHLLTGAACQRCQKGVWGFSLMSLVRNKKKTSYFSICLITSYCTMFCSCSIITSVFGPLLVWITIRFWSFWLQAPSLTRWRFLRLAACLVIAPDEESDVLIKLKEVEMCHVFTLKVKKKKVCAKHSSLMSLVWRIPGSNIYWESTNWHHPWPASSPVSQFALAAHPQSPAIQWGNR